MSTYVFYLYGNQNITMGYDQTIETSRSFSHESSKGRGKQISYHLAGNKIILLPRRGCISGELSGDCVDKKINCSVSNHTFN